MTPYQAKKLAQDRGYPVEEFLEGYIQGVKKHKITLLCDHHELKDMAEEETDPITAGVYQRWADDKLKEHGEIDGMVASAERLMKPEREGEGRITDEMIAQAKDYPVERLVEFDRSGKALAFCHDDKSPSMNWNRKANRAHCFPCGKSFNAVDILMVRDGFTFVNAVKHLSGEM